MRGYLGLAAGAALVCMPATARAEATTDKAWLDVGAFWAQIDSNLQLDNTTLGIEGTKVDFERHLGLDSSRALPKISGGIRIGSRFRLEGDFFRLGRESELAIEETLRIDDTTFPIGALVETEFDTDIYRIALGYSLVRTERGEFGVSAGAHYSRGKFEITATALGLTLAERRSKSFPLPNVGLYGNMHLFGPVSLQGSADAFKLKYGKYKGSLIDLQLGLEVRALKNVGLGLGYRYAGYELKGSKSDWRGKLDYSYSGPIAYVQLAF